MLVSKDWIDPVQNFHYGLGSSQADRQQFFSAGLFDHVVESFYLKNIKNIKSSSFAHCL